MPEAKSGGVIIARSTNMFVTPPGLLGWNHLIDPDQYQPPDGPLQYNYKVSHHQTDDQLEALTKRLQDCIESAVWPLFLKEAAKKGQGERAKTVKGRTVMEPWVMPSAQEFIDGQLKAFKEGDRIELPSMEYRNAAFYKDRHGDQQRKTMRATDAQNHAVDLKAARMGYQSVIQVLLTPSVYSSAAINKGDPSISLKLQGIRILKLEQYGSGGPAMGDISEEDQALMAGADMDQDLSAYAPAAKVVAHTGGTSDLDESDMPF